VGRHAVIDMNNGIGHRTHLFKLCGNRDIHDNDHHEYGRIPYHQSGKYRQFHNENPRADLSFTAEDGH
jgi:hypothetical protein